LLKNFDRTVVNELFLNERVTVVYESVGTIGSSVRALLERSKFTMALRGSNKGASNSDSALPLMLILQGDEPLKRFQLQVGDAIGGKI